MVGSRLLGLSVTGRQQEEKLRITRILAEPKGGILFAEIRVIRSFLFCSGKWPTANLVTVQK